MNRKKSGELRGRIGIKALEGRRAPDASPEITFEQTFLIPVSGRNAAGRGRISNLLNLGLRQERNGHIYFTIPLHRRLSPVMDLPRIVKKSHAHGALEHVLFRTSIRVSREKRHRGEWKIKKPQILIKR